MKKLILSLLFFFALLLSFSTIQTANAQTTRTVNVNYIVIDTNNNKVLNGPGEKCYIDSIQSLKIGSSTYPWSNRNESCSVTTGRISKSFSTNQKVLVQLNLGNSDFQVTGMKVSDTSTNGSLKIINSNSTSVDISGRDANIYFFIKPSTTPSCNKKPTVNVTVKQNNADSVVYGGTIKNNNDENCPAKGFNISYTINIPDLLDGWQVLFTKGSVNAKNSIAISAVAGQSAQSFSFKVTPKSTATPKTYDLQLKAQDNSNNIYQLEPFKYTVTNENSSGGNGGGNNDACDSDSQCKSKNAAKPACKNAGSESSTCVECTSNNASRCSSTEKCENNACVPKNTGSTPEKCERARPTLDVTPNSSNGNPGDEKEYTIAIKNNDSAKCAPSIIDISRVGITGWKAALEKNSLEIAPGVTKKTKMLVKSPASADSGPATLTVNIQRTNGALISENITYDVQAIDDTPISDGPTDEPTVTEEPEISEEPVISNSPTGIPGQTKLTLRVGIDGIGTTKRIPIGGNKNPDHANRNLTVRMFNAANNTPADIFQSHTLTFNKESNKFEGTLNFGDNFQSGIYNIFIEGPGVLRGQLPGSVTLTRGMTKTAQTIDLIAGDINKVDRSNNNIDINDYNVLISCSIYSQDRTACESNPNYERYSDLDDNGIVDEDDFTLWLKEISNQGGTELPE